MPAKFVKKKQHLQKLMLSKIEKKSSKILRKFLLARKIGHNISKFKVIIKKLVVWNNCAKRKIVPETYWKRWC